MFHKKVCAGVWAQWTYVALPAEFSDASAGRAGDRAHVLEWHSRNFPARSSTPDCSRSFAYQWDLGRGVARAGIPRRTAIQDTKWPHLGPGSSTWEQCSDMGSAGLVARSARVGEERCHVPRGWCTSGRARWISVAVWPWRDHACWASWWISSRRAVGWKSQNWMAESMRASQGTVGPGRVEGVRACDDSVQ